MDVYPKATVERAIKVQEVILRAIKRKITEWQATEIIGISDRSIRRWRERYEEQGYDGLLVGRRVGRAANGCASGQVEQFGLFRSGLPIALFQNGCAPAATVLNIVARPRIRHGNSFSRGISNVMVRNLSSRSGTYSATACTRSSSALREVVSAKWDFFYVTTEIW
jgi:hypothetical protein